MSNDVLKTVDPKSVMRFKNYLYADIYPGGKKCGFISVDVNITGYADVEATALFINKVYSGHPFYLGGVPHNVHMLCAYSFYSKKTIKNTTPLMSKVLGSTALTYFSFGNAGALPFFRTCLNKFHNQHKRETYHITRVVLVLDTLSV